MAILQHWKKSRKMIVVVNQQPCSTQQELQQRLRKVFRGKLYPIEIRIYDPAVQRILLPLMIYSPKDLLPPDVGTLVEDQFCKIPSPKEPMAETIEISLAITQIMNDSQNQTAVIICAAMICALGKGYENISFETIPSIYSHWKSLSTVVIQMQQ